jgi:hypothetical protein
MRAKLYPKNEKPFYGVNYSLSHEDRSIETKIFYLLREAKKFLASMPHGYLMRCAVGKAEVLVYKNFQPSAQEQLRINQILKNWNVA